MNRRTFFGLFAVPITTALAVQLEPVRFHGDFADISWDDPSRTVHARVALVNAAEGRIASKELEHCILAGNCLKADNVTFGPFPYDTTVDYVALETPATPPIRLPWDGILLTTEVPLVLRKGNTLTLQWHEGRVASFL